MTGIVKRLCDVQVVEVMDDCHEAAQLIVDLCDGLRTAIWRIEDMLKGDDGQAWKEAERALPQLKKILGEEK